MPKFLFLFCIRLIIYSYGRYKCSELLGTTSFVTAGLRRFSAEGISQSLIIICSWIVSLPETYVIDVVGPSGVGWIIVDDEGPRSLPDTGRLLKTAGLFLGRYHGHESLYNLLVQVSHGSARIFHSSKKQRVPLLAKMENQVRGFAVELENNPVVELKNRRALVALLGLRIGLTVWYR